MTTMTTTTVAEMKTAIENMTIQEMTLPGKTPRSKSTKLLVLHVDAYMVDNTLYSGVARDLAFATTIEKKGYTADAFDTVLFRGKSDTLHSIPYWVAFDNYIHYATEATVNYNLPENLEHAFSA